MYRSNNPKTWWVTPELKFLSNIDYGLQVANWQRANPKKRGKPPQPMKWPKEAGSVLTGEQQRERKKRFLEARKAVS